MEAGMDVARINMDFFESNQIETLISNIKDASKQLQHPCPIFIDMKGMLIRTLSTNKEIPIEEGQRVCMTDDPSMVGVYDDLIVIDAKNFAGKLEENDKIIINYGQIELTVTGFEKKEEYKKKQQDLKVP